MAKFEYTYSDGYVYSVDMYNLISGCKTQYQAKNGFGPYQANLLAVDNPNADQTSLAYMNDQESALISAKATIINCYNNANNNYKWWKQKVKDCKDFNGLFKKCHKQSTFCNWSVGSLKTIRNEWKAAKKSWLNTKAQVLVLQKAITEQVGIETNQQIDITELNNEIAMTNMLISEANLKEAQSEGWERMNKTITLFVPMIIVVLIIYLIVKK